MATKSILKNINITDKTTAKAFVNALEDATSTKNVKPVSHTQDFISVSKSEIRKMFGSSK